MNVLCGFKTADSTDKEEEKRLGVKEKRDVVEVDVDDAIWRSPVKKM